MDMYSLLPLQAVDSKTSISEEEVEALVPVETPNRVDKTMTRSVIEVINQTVTNIPNCSITFEGDSFSLITNFQAPHLALVQAVNGMDIPAYMDDILALIKDRLKEAGHTGLKITPLSMDVTPSGQTGRTRNIIFDVNGTFTIE